MLLILHYVLCFHNLNNPINFCYHKFSHTKINYKIHDKKFLAIVDDFKELCHVLEGTRHEIIVYFDHKNL
jgi:hypothetical protein